MAAVKSMKNNDTFKQIWFEEYEKVKKDIRRRQVFKNKKWKHIWYKGISRDEKLREIWLCQRSMKRGATMALARPFSWCCDATPSRPSTVWLPRGPVSAYVWWSDRPALFDFGSASSCWTALYRLLSICAVVFGLSSLLSLGCFSQKWDCTENQPQLETRYYERDIDIRWYEKIWKELKRIEKSGTKEYEKVS